MPYVIRNANGSFVKLPTLNNEARETFNLQKARIFTSPKVALVESTTTTQRVWEAELLLHKLYTGTEDSE